MTIYYIYEVPGHKNGATADWEKRSSENFETYGIQPILIETMEGPNEPEFWQIVGDREWELADQNGYTKGNHYRKARETRRRWTKEDMSKGGQTNVRTGHLQSISSNAAKISNSLRKGKKTRVKECPHCGKIGGVAGMTRYHGDNCKHKKIL